MVHLPLIRSVTLLAPLRYARHEVRVVSGRSGMSYTRLSTFLGSFLILTTSLRFV